jgi:hypothetical protein
MSLFPRKRLKNLYIPDKMIDIQNGAPEYPVLSIGFTSHKSNTGNKMIHTVASKRRREALPGEMARANKGVVI